MMIVEGITVLIMWIENNYLRMPICILSLTTPLHQPMNNRRDGSRFTRTGRT